MILFSITETFINNIIFLQYKLLIILFDLFYWKLIYIKNIFNIKIVFAK